MIHEYAVDPELLVEWSESHVSAAHFADSFGLGRPRIVSRYPVDWRECAKRCWDARQARATTDEEKGKLELQRERFVELSRILSEVTVNRSTLGYVNSKTWLDNAAIHAPNPLPSILTPRAAGASAHVLVGEGIIGNSIWKRDGAKSVARDAQALASAVNSLLMCCDKILFVDPYFSRLRPAHVEVFLLFLGRMKSRVGLANPSRVEVLTSLSGRDPPTWSEFEKGCKSRIEPRLRAVESKARGPEGDRLSG